MGQSAVVADSTMVVAKLCIVYYQHSMLGAIVQEDA